MEFEIDDFNVEQRLERCSAVYHIITAEKRLAQVAGIRAALFHRWKWEVDDGLHRQDNCVRMYKPVNSHWEETES